MKRVAAITISLASCVAGAADKTGYSWMNPTPSEFLRPMATDRPDATESPTTVDAGRIQIEMSFAQHTRDRRHPDRSDVRITEWNVAPVNVRLGLTHNTELQIVVDNFLRIEERSASASTRDRSSGWGDITLRLKKNLIGNDGGETAVALMPFIKLPTNSGGIGNNRVEGGLIVPASVTLGRREFGVMTVLEIIHDGGGYTAAWLNTIATGAEFTETLGGFIELASVTGEGSHSLTFNAGLTLAVSGDLQLDAGVNVGLTRAAPDLATFIGISVRY